MSGTMNIRQVAQYPLATAIGAGDVSLIQQGGLGGPYASIAPSDLVGSAMAGPGTILEIGDGSWLDFNGLTFGSDGARLVSSAPVAAPSLIADVISASSIAANAISVNGSPVLTEFDLGAFNPVTSFNTRAGDIVLETADILQAGGAPQVDAHFSGWITAPTPWDLTLDDDTVATCRWTQQAMCAFTTCNPFVYTFNGRSGNIQLTTADINQAYATPDGAYPTAPSPVLGDASNRIATTSFVDESLEELNLTVTNNFTAADNYILGLVQTQYAPLNSPNLTGTPTAPTANPGTHTGQLATTAFVMAAVSASTAGVSSFNTRTGIVTLQGADIQAAGGALLNSPALTGTPTAPTPAPGTNSTVLATTAFVQAAITAMTAGVASFNTRTGAVTLTLADVTGTGVLANTALTGTPTAPTATPATNTTQLATTAFVQAAITAAAGVASFNGRTGAVTLIGADVSAAGGALSASPTFTGTPAAPTAVPGTNTTQLATTAFVAAAIASAGSGVYLPLAGGTMTGSISISPSSWPSLVLNRPDATTANQVVGRTNNLNRWVIVLGDQTAESGSNVGGNFALQRCSDAGALIDAPLNIARSSGVATFSTFIAVGSGGVVYNGLPSGTNSIGFTWIAPLALYVNGTSMGNIAVTSDYRTKKDVAGLPGTWDIVKKLRPVRYTQRDAFDGLFRADDVERWGFLAHELQEATIQDAATGIKDQDNAVQSPNPWTIIAALTRALQEAMARIEALEAS